jgi:hypothetical protein
MAIGVKQIMGFVGHIRWRILLPIAAGLIFVTLCFATTRQSGVIDWGLWGPSTENPSGWGTESADIGTPADVVLFAFNLPALIVLLPLLPLTYWIESEFVLRSAWGVAAVGQWFLIGRYFDFQRGLLLAAGKPKLPLWLLKVLFSLTMVAGALAFGIGLYSIVGHSTIWGIGMAASLLFWGFTLLIFALRWRASSAWTSDHFSFLRLS